MNFQGVEEEQGTKRLKKSSSTHCKVVVKAAYVKSSGTGPTAVLSYFSTKEICNSKNFSDSLCSQPFANISVCLAPC